MNRVALLVLAVLALATAFVWLGTVRFDSDFVAMYAAAHGVVNGISPWDHAGQSALLTREYDLDSPFPVLPFGYPPWYVLVTFPLGWLDYATAGRAFMVLNLGWLGLAAAALTAGRDLEPRALLTAAMSLYLPLVGLVVVGQYTLPVLAGTAVALWAWPRRQPWLLAVGALLISFKWHVGALPALGFAVLLLRDPALLRRTVGPLAAVFGVASLLGLILDPAWPVRYPRSVIELSQADVNAVCDTCSSTAWSIATRTPVPTWAAGLGLLVAGAAGLAARQLWRSPRAFIAAVTALTLASLPYVRNYDFALLGLAWVVAADRSRTVPERALLGLLWAAPMALPFLDRGAADEVLGTSALALFGLLLAQGPAVDDPATDG